MIIGRWIVIVFFLFAGWISHSQVSGYPFAPWRLLSYNGQVNVFGTYFDSGIGSRDIISNGYQYGFGGSINATSYIYHPNFLFLSVSGGYSPTDGEVISSIYSDYVTNYALSQYSITASFLRSFDYNFSVYYDYSNVDSKDQFLERDIMVRNWGGIFSYNNKFNIATKFNKALRKETDQLSEREQSLETTSLIGSVKRSFFKKDINELSFNLNRITSETNGLNKNEIESIGANYFNRIYLNKNATIPLSSRLGLVKQDGSNSYLLTYFSEEISFPITKKLYFVNTNRINRTERNQQLLKEFHSMGGFDYSLYESLSAHLNANYMNQNMREYDLNNLVISSGINYSKKLPFIRGNLSLGYTYLFLQQNNKSQDSYLSLFDEVHVLQDGVIELLNTPNGIIESVVVTDITGTIIYEENLDYILIQRGANIEIQRLFGSLIENNGQVLIDYETIQNYSYDYEGNSNSFSASLTALNDFIRIGYEYFVRDYTINTGNLQNLGLESLEKNRYSASLRYKIFSGGASYTENESSLFKYNLRQYFFNLNTSITKKINLSFEARLDDYPLYFKEGETQKIISLSSRLSYELSGNSNFIFNARYDEQSGNIQNYNLFSANGEFRWKLNQLDLSLRVRYFNRKSIFSGNGQQYFATTINIKRKF